MLGTGCAGIIMTLILSLGFLNEKDYNSQVTMEFRREKIFH